MPPNAALDRLRSVVRGRDTAPPVRILVVGVPRSGTTWVAETLACAPGVTWVNEPDNFQSDPFAHVSQSELGRFPVLDAGSSARSYRVLWNLAFSGGWPRGGMTTATWRLAARLPLGASIPLLTQAARVSSVRRSRPSHVVVKSVFNIFALEWIVSRYHPRVVVVRSHPLNIASSWISLAISGSLLDSSWVGANRPDLAAATAGTVDSDAGATALAVGVLTVALDEAIARHPEWMVVDHEDLCADPANGFKQMYSALELNWDGAVEAHIRRTNRPGKGMQTARIAAEQPARWLRLTEDQLADVQRVFAALPLERCAPDATPAARREATGQARRKGPLLADASG